MSSLQQTIALVRHGETDWNLAKRIQGRTEVPLNPTGREQAAATAELLTGGPWQRTFASPLGRAIETAEIIARHLGIAEPTVEAELWERDFGPAEGLLISEVEERWPDLEIPGAEPLATLATRASGAMVRLLEDAPGSVIVAHGAMLRAGIGQLTGTAMPRIANGEVWLLTKTEAGISASVQATAARR